MSAPAPATERRIAGTGVSAIGLGAMHLSVEGRPDPEQARRTLLAALDAGCTLVDTADAYCTGPWELGHNERLVADALAQWAGDPDEVLVATKGGHVRPGDGSWRVDGRPEHLRAACEASLRALGVEAIGLYQFHRPDPAVPYAESVGTLGELQREGKVRHVGVSNANLAQLEIAAATVELASVQNELSPWFASSFDELRWCAARDIAFLPWAPLGGTGRAAGLSGALPTFAAVAERAGVSTARVILAWELAQADVVIPIPGARRPQTALDSLAAATLRLDVADLATLDAAVLPFGNDVP